MISEQKKSQIISALQTEKNKLGSMNNVAKKLAISPATISNNLLKSENWRNVSDTMWTDIAAILGVSLVDRNWNLVPTTNLKIMQATFQDAQNEALFMGVSEKAGSGKTSSIAHYVDRDSDHSVYALQCEEWSLKAFLIRLSKELGVTAGRYDSVQDMTDAIVRFFKQRSKEVRPLLILDEADKLKPAAKRFLIPLYNRLEDEIGLVVCGTENLEKEIKNGVRRAEKGYDEIDSRLGRNWVHLVGSTKTDVSDICRANGVSDSDAIARVIEKCGLTRKLVGGKYIEVVEDNRAIKRAVKAERLRMAHAA